MLATIERPADSSADVLTSAECAVLAEFLAPYTPEPSIPGHPHTGMFTAAEVALFESARAKIEARA